VLARGLAVKRICEMLGTLDDHANARHVLASDFGYARRRGGGNGCGVHSLTRNPLWLQVVISSRLTVSLRCLWFIRYRGQVGD
jgi:hypothetical protein